MDISGSSSTCHQTAAMGVVCVPFRRFNTLRHKLDRKRYQQQRWNDLAGMEATMNLLLAPKSTPPKGQPLRKITCRARRCDSDAKWSDKVDIDAGVSRTCGADGASPAAAAATAVAEEARDTCGADVQPELCRAYASSDLSDYAALLSTDKESGKHRSTWASQCLHVELREARALSPLEIEVSSPHSTADSMISSEVEPRMSPPDDALSSALSTSDAVSDALSHMTVDQLDEFEKAVVVLMKVCNHLQMRLSPPGQ